MGAVLSGECSTILNTTMSISQRRPSATATPSSSEGMFRDRPALDAFAAELRTLQANPSDATLSWKHALGPAVQTEALRLLEIRNWLQAQVLPRSRQRD